MTLLSTSLCLLVIASDIFANRHGIRPRVIDGVDDDTDEYPYVVSLQFIPNEDTPPLFSHFKNTPMRAGTGSLITDRWILTASHCLIEFNAMKVTLVRYGDMSLPVNGTTFFRKVLKTIVNPSYQVLFGKRQYLVGSQHVRNDIGLLVLEKKIPLKYYGILSAVDFNSLMGLRARYAGFGMNWSEELNRTKKVAEIGKLQLKPLQIGDAAIVKCDKSSYKTSGPFICIVAPCAKRRQSPSFGDSGGPLLVGNKIVGVLYGPVVKNPGVFLYTPVSPYLDWINDVMSKEK